MATVRTEVRSEVATSREPAYVRVYLDEELVAEIIATIALKQGADGGWYDCVIFEQQK